MVVFRNGNEEVSTALSILRQNHYLTANFLVKSEAREYKINQSSLFDSSIKIIIKINK